MSPTGNTAPLGQRYTEGVRRHGHQPLLTYYDDRSGERTELSYATFDNWASKAANLLVEELDAGIGTRVSLGLTDHWKGAVLVAATWKVGGVVVLDGTADLDVVELGNEVLAFADDYDDLDVALGAAALHADGRTWTQAELVEQATDAISAGERVLTTARLDSLDGVVGVMLSPLLAGGSAVWCPHLDAAGVQHRADQERARPL